MTRRFSTASLPASILYYYYFTGIPTLPLLLILRPPSPCVVIIPLPSLIPISLLLLRITSRRIVMIAQASLLCRHCYSDLPHIPQITPSAALRSRCYTVSLPSIPLLPIRPLTILLLLQTFFTSHHYYFSELFHIL